MLYSIHGSGSFLAIVRTMAHQVNIDTFDHIILFVPLINFTIGSN